MVLKRTYAAFSGVTKYEPNGPSIGDYSFMPLDPT